MAIPTFVAALLQPFVELWADASHWQFSINRGYQDPRYSIVPDDGMMGGAFRRMGTTDFQLTGVNAIGPLFDQRFPIRVSFRTRWTVQAGQSHRWLGQGVLYSAESSYGGGLTLDAGGWGNPLAGYPSSDAVPGGAAFQNGAAFDVDVDWNPATGLMRTRINGGEWGISRQAAAWVGAAPKWPVTPWWGGYADPAYLDVGPIKVAGKHLWGAQDDFGWIEWLKSPNTALLSAPDADSGSLGGLTGQASTGELWAWESGVNSPSAAALAVPVQDWSAVSTIAGLATNFQYDELRLALHNYRAGQLRIFVRYADDGSSVFKDANGADQDVVPLCTTASGPYTAPGTLALSLAAVQAGRTVYLDVQGHTDPTWGAMNAQPRLGGAWISYAEFRGITLRATATLNGSASLPVTRAAKLTGQSTTLSAVAKAGGLASLKALVTVFRS